MSDAIETPNFREMDIGKLRQYAAHLRLAIAKTAKKDEIIEAIDRKLKGRSVVEIADEGTSLKPGYARIIVLLDPMPGAPNSPVYLNANGYQCTIPRGVECVVPMRVVRVLNDAKVKRLTQQMVVDQHGREVFKDITTVVPSYPFQILEQRAGPEVLTTLELTKQKSAGPKRRYHQMFGRWPKPRELTRAIEQKLISLGDDEILDPSAEKLMGASDNE